MHGYEQAEVCKKFSTIVLRDLAFKKLQLFNNRKRKRLLVIIYSQLGNRKFINTLILQVPLVQQALDRCVSIVFNQKKYFQMHLLGKKTLDLMMNLILTRYNVIIL